MKDNLPPMPPVTDELSKICREAMDWGRSYGQRLNTPYELLDEIAGQFADKARAALAQAQSQSLPDGWKLVPVEATDKMVQACHHIDLSYMPGQEGADRAVIYRAMVEASPAQPVQPAAEELAECKAAYESQFRGLHALKAQRDALLEALKGLVSLEADGRQAAESAIEYWEAARAAIAAAEKGGAS